MILDNENVKYFPQAGDECQFKSLGSYYAEDFVWCKYHGKLVNGEGLIVEYVKATPDITVVDAFDPELTEFRRSST
jgi:hypothetical protein